MKKKEDKSGKTIMYAGIGIDLVVSTVVGGVIGYFLDRWLGTSPWLLVIFLILGAVSGFLTVFRIIERGERNS